MWGARAQKSGSDRSGACLLASLLWLSFLPQQTRAANISSAANITAAQTALSLSQVCGKSKFQGKIFGGQKAGSERWPWQASLRLYGSHICGAVLIDKNWVAGAAHCFQRSHNPNDYQILLGYTKLSSPTKYSRQLSVNKLIVHKDYDKLHRQGSDIVLMQLHSPVEYSSHIFPACVPKKDIQIPENKACWATGWGHLREDVSHPLPDDLHEVQLTLMENDLCKSFFPPPQPGSTSSYYIYDDMLCAADYEMTKSICAGDSGGPLVCSLNGSWYVVGLTSWSASCETPIATPSVFTRVSYFNKWIDDNKKSSPNPSPEWSHKPPNKTPGGHKPSPPGGGENTDGTVSENDGVVMKPAVCTALLSSQVLLLQLVYFRTL
ncbi:serine protease 40-like [Psammomys obesus]|uniref:serine protease 40-like n=1 Tax=Psammomys obesus TaxID=48139 RepID=UPI0024534499|nr:serine protease 40-like [Psammomys obesus]